MNEIVVTGPNGITMRFPPGTDAATINEVMRQATEGPAAAQSLGPYGQPVQIAPPAGTGQPGVSPLDTFNRQMQEGGNELGRDFRQWGGATYGGAADVGLFGFDDELSGLIEGMWPGGPTVSEAVESNRAWKNQQREQNPTMFALGGLATLPLARYVPTVPLPGVTGASVAARGARAAVTGLAGGAAYGAGTADGMPMAPYAGVGAAAGAALGPVGPIVGSLGRGVASILRKAPPTSTPLPWLNQRAAGSVEGALARDARTAATRAGTLLPPTGGQPGAYLRRAADTVEQERAVGMPMILADAGGLETRRLTRTAADMSPTAASVLDAELSPRFTAQGTRVQEQVADITGQPLRGDTGATRDALEVQARIENRTRYDAAYNDPAAQAVWSPRLAELTRSPTVQTAMRDVTRRAADDAAVMGTPVVRNPFVPNAAGGLSLQGNTVPSLQYWDIVQRNLSDAIDNAAGGERRQLTQIRNALLDELDTTVPQFATARAGAAAAFGARDALEAGETMARDFRIPTGDFQRAFNELSPAEQDLFREGYTNQIMTDIGQTGDNRSVVNRSVFNTQQGRDRTAIVFGRAQADEIENMVRLENVMNAVKTIAQGNSTTAPRLADMARAFGQSPTTAAVGVGGATTFVLGPNLRTLIPMGLAFGARKGQAALNQAVAERVGTLLASGDPAAIREAAELLARTPVGNLALRNLEMGLSRAFSAAGTGTAVDFLEGAGAPGFGARQ